MPSFNKVILIGNLTRDPELRFTPKGAAVCAFTLGVNEEFKGSDGQQKKETAFIGCEAWGKQAEALAQYVRKGDPLFIEGKLRQESWEDKESGKKHSKTKVSVLTFQLLTRKPEGARPEPQARTSAPSTKPELPPDNDDVPF